LALRARFDPAVEDVARVEAEQAGLKDDEIEPVVEATVIKVALHAHAHGWALPSLPIDLNAHVVESSHIALEVDRLVMVARAFAGSPLPKRCLRMVCDRLSEDSGALS
jgi:hypothetical protein